MAKLTYDPLQIYFGIDTLKLKSHDTKLDNKLLTDVFLDILERLKKLEEGRNENSN